MTAKPLKTPPPYAINSVDNALRIAAILQFEGPLTVSEIARRISVANSTAHRLLSMLVYRDFAVQNRDRTYRVGPVLQLGAASHAATTLKDAALPHMQRVVDLLDESVNLTVRVGDRARFIATVESTHGRGTTNRAGMMFPAHHTTAGLLLLAELSLDELAALYETTAKGILDEDRPDFAALTLELQKIRRNGFAVNHERSERGLIAIGVPVRDPAGVAIAGLSVSMPSTRYRQEHLPRLVAVLSASAAASVPRPSAE